MLYEVITIYPNAVDIPNNGIDENCDGADSVDTTLLDNDGDGFTQATGDCDDTNAAINPEAVESCTDTIDNNCNGLVDVHVITSYSIHYTKLYEWPDGEGSAG